MQLTAYGLDVASKGIDLRPFDIAMFEAGNSVLADVQGLGDLDLREAERFAEFPQLVSTNLVEHPAFVLFYGGAVDGSFRK
jgi:hypothetical protein